MRLAEETLRPLCKFGGSRRMSPKSTRAVPWYLFLVRTADEDLIERCLPSAAALHQCGEFEVPPNIAARSSRNFHTGRQPAGRPSPPPATRSWSVPERPQQGSGRPSWDARLTGYIRNGGSALIPGLAFIHARGVQSARRCVPVAIGLAFGEAAPRRSRLCVQTDGKHQCRHRRESQKHFHRVTPVVCWIWNRRLAHVLAGEPVSPSPQHAVGEETLCPLCKFGLHGAVIRIKEGSYLHADALEPVPRTRCFENPGGDIVGFDKNAFVDAIRSGLRRMPIDRRPMGRGSRRSLTYVVDPTQSLSIKVGD